MSETQANEAVNEETVSAEDAAILAEQEAYLNDGEPEAEPQAAAEPEPEPQAAPAQSDKSANLQKALSESRFQQRQTQRQLKEIQEAMAQMRQPQQQEQGEQVQLDPDNDPIGTLRYVTTRLRAYEHQERERLQQVAQQQEEERTISDLTSYMGESEQMARTELPDYDHAMNFQVQSRGAELKALGYPEDQIPELVKNEYLGLIHSARQNGQNPAYLVYQQAKARGYTGPPAEAAEGAPAPVQGTAQKQLDAIRKGQETPKTSRGSSGGSNSGSITEEMLMSAKGSEFDKLWAQFEKQNAS